jgi:UDP-N-acetylglucosamine:LPS N-acetylglucosamine transferase
MPVTTPMQVVIFYSSIGRGHISAAQGIRDEILRQAPDCAITLKDIRDFMLPVWRTLDETLYWFVANSLPDCFESMFRSMQARGNRVPSLAMLQNDYPEAKVLAYLDRLRPDAVIASHYGAAQVLGTLREKGHLADTRIAWLHTDYFEGYFPRISKRIDKTFLGHPDLEARWLAAGVPPDKVTASGIPVAIEAVRGASRKLPIRELGLSARVHTVLLAGGKEGAIDYAAIVRSLAGRRDKPLQIIAACGLNGGQARRLRALASKLPAHIRLETLGLVPRERMLALMRGCDLLVTKAGGMTPTEAFATGLPTVLLDVVSGHERENAALFHDLGLAEVVSSGKEAGERAAEILSSRGRLRRMGRAQALFRRASDHEAIARFALDARFAPSRPEVDFGTEDGTPVGNAREALSRLDAESPADLELLLSYSTAQSPQVIVVENPFGHIAVRLRDKVYSTNHIADPELDPNLLQAIDLDDYLYGVKRPSRSQLHVNTYGMAYGRATIGLRVSGLPARAIERMLDQTRTIEAEFREGSLKWGKERFNCADAVVRILKAGGCDVSPVLDKVWLPTMPLDVFGRARKVFGRDPSISTEFVAYQQLPGTGAKYRFGRFPLSVGQPLRSATRILRRDSVDPLEGLPTKQVVAYAGDRTLTVEDLESRPRASAARAPDGADAAALKDAVVSDLRRIVRANLERSRARVRGLSEAQVLRQGRALVEGSVLAARFSVEQAGRLLPVEETRSLLTGLGVLAEKYRGLDPQHLTRRQLASYLASLQAFAASMVASLSAPASPAGWSDPVRRAFWRDIDRLCRLLLAQLEK